jgi:hypothetical protein
VGLKCPNSLGEIDMQVPSWLVEKEKREKEKVVENVVKENWLVHWWKKVIYEEYHLTIWFVASKEVDANGNTSYKRVEKYYKAMKVGKLTPKLIKFVDMDKQSVEIRSEEPMNWDLVKVY